MSDLRIIFSAPDEFTFLPVDQLPDPRFFGDFSTELHARNVLFPRGTAAVKWGDTRGILDTRDFEILLAGSSDGKSVGVIMHARSGAICLLLVDPDGKVSFLPTCVSRLKRQTEDLVPGYQAALSAALEDLRRRDPLVDAKDCDDDELEGICIEYDRYGGSYSGAYCLAWLGEPATYSDDEEYWVSGFDRGVVGKGETIGEALDDLHRIVGERRRTIRLDLVG